MAELMTSMVRKTYCVSRVLQIISEHACTVSYMFYTGKNKTVNTGIIYCVSGWEELFIMFYQERIYVLL